MHTRIEGTRRQGLQRSRWLDEVKKDIQQIGIRNWRNTGKEGKIIVLVYKSCHVACSLGQE